MPATLYISYDGMTDPLGQSQVIPYLKGLNKNGIRIILLSYEKETRKANKEKIRLELEASGIIWKPLKYHKSPSLPATLYDLVSGVFFAWKYCKKYNINLIHCRGHYLTSLIAIIVKNFHAFKLVFDMRGFWADERIEGNIWSITNSIQRQFYNFSKKHEKQILQTADHTIVLTSKAKHYLINNYKYSGNISVIPCMADLDLFAYKGDETRNNFRRKLGVDKEIILTYLGSLGTWYMTREILDFYRVFQDFSPDVRLMFLTNDDPEIIYKLIKDKDVKGKEIIIRSVSRAEVPDYLSSADAGIFFIRPTFSKIASSPTKHAEFLGCGLPLVCNTKIGDVDQIVKESNTGVLIEDFKEVDYKKAASELLSLIRHTNREEIRKVAIKYYDLEEGIRRYKEIYEKLLEI